MSVTVNGSNGLTFNDGSTQATAPKVGMVNRCINGSMMIDQRNAGASVSNTVGALYTLDRWNARGTQASKYTIQQNAGSVTPPEGFSKYLGATSSSAYSVTSTDYFTIQQIIEGFNIADLAWGTANAKPITISFWVRSSLTGTFGGSLISSAANRSYPFTYTINSANTWEYETITIAGDTSGTWATDNTAGVYVNFGIGVGSSASGTAGAWDASLKWSATGATSVVGTNGATFYITGVQLEKGSTATSFDYRPYGTELQLCQRYCYVDNYTGNAYTRFPVGFASNTNQSIIVLNFPVTMRTIPSLTWNGAFAEVVASGGGATGTSVTITSDGNSTNHAAVAFNYSSGSVTLNSLNGVRTNNSTTWYARFEAEL